MTTNDGLCQRVLLEEVSDLGLRLVVINIFNCEARVQLSFLYVKTFRCA